MSRIATPTVHEQMDRADRIKETVASLPPSKGYVQPKTIEEFERVYRQEYQQELESCDRWIMWCSKQNPPDTHGFNFHQGMRAAHVFHNIKIEQLLRVLKHEEPNV